ncbi:MAG: hypothetical protein NT158_09955 [Cyanobacteria bacterium]|nr:hypothetical protein [Cyanobacteriota bacterium]
MTPSAQAAITPYSNRAAFEAALVPGAYTETQMYPNYPNYSGGSGFSYTATTSGLDSPLVGVDDLTTGDSNPSTIDIVFGPGIKAFGGYFYNNDPSGSFIGGPFTISLNGGTAIFSETSMSTTTFYGFISDADLVDALISVANTDYATAGSVIVGTTPSPVPGSLPLLGVRGRLGLEPPPALSSGCRSRRFLKAIGRPCCWCRPGPGTSA